jgi:hypothetical protein
MLPTAYVYPVDDNSNINELRLLSSNITLLAHAARAT